MTAILNTLKSVLKSAYTFMGTIDSGQLTSDFCKIGTSCDNSNDKMVHLTECQNTQSSSVNGTYEVSNTMTNSFQETLKDKGVEMTKLENVIRHINAIVEENMECKKRKLEEPLTEPSNKRIKTATSPHASVENLENTGRGKRIKKPSKRSHFYDAYNDESEHLKRPEKRFAGDSEDKEYIPTHKLSGNEAENITITSCSKENGLPDLVQAMTSSEQTSVCIDAGNAKVREHKGKNVEEETRVTNEDGEMENLTIIDIANSSDEEVDESTESQQGGFLDVASNQLSVQPSSGTSGPSIHRVTTGGIITSGDKHTSRPPVLMPAETHCLTVNMGSRLTVSDRNHLGTCSKEVNKPITVAPAQPMMVKHSIPPKETNLVSCLKPQKKSQKKPLKKTQKKSYAFDQMFDDAELKHINKLKSLTTKKQDKPSDTGKQAVGPYVRCKGLKDSLQACRVVNVKDSQDVEHYSNPAKYSVVPSEACSSRGTSQMSDDVPWKCIFCSHGSSHMDSGDLFGPYFPNQSPASQISAEEPTSLLPPDADSKNPSSRDLSSKQPTSVLPNGLPSEIWVHSDCAIWTNGIFVSGGRLRGLEEAALAAQNSMCCSCNHKGATLGCLVKGCELKYHYLCACQTGCTFQEENFSILCPKHKTYRINKPISTTEAARLL